STSTPSVPVCRSRRPAPSWRRPRGAARWWSPPRPAPARPPWCRRWSRTSRTGSPWSPSRAGSRCGGPPAASPSWPAPHRAGRAAARRLAQLDGTSPGGPVGFTVRGQREVGAGTRLEMLTPGVLLRRLLADPELPGVAAVLLDEVHERSLETDLLLGMLTEARQLREDLLVGAMSATLDAAAVAEVLDGAGIVEVPSALHPLSIDHAPSPAARLDVRGVTREYLDHLARTAARTQ